MKTNDFENLMTILRKININYAVINDEEIIITDPKMGNKVIKFIFNNNEAKEAKILVY